MKLFNWLLKPFKKAEKNPETKLQFLTPTVKKKSKSDTKYYHTDAIIEVKGHRLGVFPLTVVAENKSMVQHIIANETKLIPTNIHEDKSYVRRQQQ